MSMDASFPNKRHFDHSPVDRSDYPHHTPTSSTKRRHQQHHPLPSSPATPQSNNNNPFRSSFKLSSGETLFRILCPASKIGGVIGKGGAIIRQFREETGAKIRIDEYTHGSEDRVIVIVASDSTRKNKDFHNNNNDDSNSEESGNSNFEESPAQKALIRVFDRIVKVDEERSKMSKEESDNGEDNSAEGSGGIPQRPVVCRMLVASNQIGCVLGRGGHIIEKIRQESGAQVRVLPKDLLPECASPGDELIQMAGKFSAVKKALLLVSNCLQENPRGDATTNNRPMGTIPHGYSNEGYGHPNHHRMGMEEEVVFRLLCQFEKVGSLIGKGGSIRRAIQTETGASIKIADSAPDADERVVVISARESLEQRHSPAQDAVLRVHGRLAEIGLESGGAPIVGRLLVHPRQVGCLWGKGGMIISEMRRVTGANIQIFPKEQVAKYGMPNDEVVQVIGGLQSVQDAMFEITGRLRETFFPVKPYYPNPGGPYQEMRPPFRPRHDNHPYEAPPHYGNEYGGPYYDRGSNPYGNERPGYGPPAYRQSPPARWNSQSGGNRYPGEVGESEGASVSVEIMVPQSLLGFIYGENNTNLAHIKQISGAQVAIHDSADGGRVVLSGTADETHTAQCLLHAFILSEQHLIP